MKTLLLSEIFPPRTGGSGRWFWEIYRRLARDEFVVAAGEDPRQQPFDAAHDLDLVRVPLTLEAWGLRSTSGVVGYFRAYRRVARIVKQRGVGRLHCARMLPEGWIAWLIKRRFGLHYDCYVHGEETNYGVQSRELGWMMRRVVAGAERLIANSRNTAAILSNEWNVPQTKIHVLHPGVDTAAFVPAERNAALRTKLGWHDRPVILTVGRLQKRKGHDQMVRALAGVREAVPNVLYAIVGEGEERARIESLIEQHNIADHVQLLGEVVDQRLVDCYQQCDLFVLPNRDVDGDIEGFGMVLLEAQSCGKPVIAGASGGTAETMNVGHTGRIVPCDGPELLAETTIELLRDAPLRRQMGEAARAWTVQRFSWESLCREAAELFDAAALDGAPAGEDGDRSLSSNRPSTQQDQLQV